MQVFGLPGHIIRNARGALAKSHVARADRRTGRQSCRYGATIVEGTRIGWRDAARRETGQSPWRLRRRRGGAVRITRDRGSMETPGSDRLALVMFSPERSNLGFQVENAFGDLLCGRTEETAGISRSGDRIALIVIDDLRDVDGDERVERWTPTPSLLESHWPMSSRLAVWRGVRRQPGLGENRAMLRCAIHRHHFNICSTISIA